MQRLTNWSIAGQIIVLLLVFIAHNVHGDEVSIKIIHPTMPDHSPTMDAYKRCVELGRDSEYCSWEFYPQLRANYTGYGDQKLNEFTSMYISNFRKMCVHMGTVDTFLRARGAKPNTDTCEQKWQLYVYQSNFDMDKIKMVRPGVEW